MAKYVGVDWAKNCWLCVTIDDEDDAPFTVERQPSIHTLWQEHNDAESIFIDIPIGLPSGDDGEADVRECDVKAKEKLGEGSSKVFYTPCREAVVCQEWDNASEKNRRILDRGISGQAWSIVPRIREVDVFLQVENINTETLLESHPEVCFNALAAGVDQSIASSKEIDSGLAERVQVIQASLSDNELSIPNWDDLKIKYEATSSPSFGRLVGKGRLDDFVDSLGLAVSAFLAGDAHQRMPDSPPNDSEGIPMQIVYHGPASSKA